VAGVSPADIKELQPTRLPLQFGDKIFLRLRIFLPKFAIALCCNKLPRQSKTFFRLFCPAQPCAITVAYVSKRAASGPPFVPGKSESTSGVKCVVLEIEIDACVGVRRWETSAGE
jgi:hypothetical protein